MTTESFRIAAALCLFLLVTTTPVPAQSPGGPAATPADDPTLYAGGDGGLVAVDADTGTVDWHWREAPATNPTVVDGVVYTGANESIYAFDATDGSVIWRYFTGGEVRASPTVVDGRVYMPTGDASSRRPPIDPGALYALAADDGDLLWNVSVMTMSRSLDVVDGRVYISEQKRVSAFDSTDGSLVWRRPLNEWVFASSTAIGDTVFTPVRNGTLMALNASSGQTRWRTAIPDRYDSDGLRSAPVFTGTSLYIKTSNGNLVALDPATGEGNGRSP